MGLKRISIQESILVRHLHIDVESRPSAIHHLLPLKGRAASTANICPDSSDQFDPHLAKRPSKLGSAFRLFGKIPFDLWPIVGMDHIAG